MTKQPEHTDQTMDLGCDPRSDPHCPSC